MTTVVSTTLGAPSFFCPDGLMEGATLPDHPVMPKGVTCNTNTPIIFYTLIFSFMLTLCSHCVVVHWSPFLSLFLFALHQ
jgi:hypothetical protein